VAGEVLGVVLPFSVLEILRLHEDSCTLLPSALAVSACVLHPDHHGVGDLARSRRLAIVANVADDHGSVANAQLGAVVVSNLRALRKAERAAQPIDRLADVRVDEDGDDGGLRDRAVRFNVLRLAW
jgi:hypothetical protein